jgi:hypothetical protein
MAVVTGRFHGCLQNNFLFKVIGLFTWEDARKMRKHGHAVETISYDPAKYKKGSYFFLPSLYSMMVA